MATRLYLSNTAPGYTPTTKRGTWTTSSSTVARLLGRRPSGATTTSAVAETSTTNNVTVLLGRWISDGAVTAGTLAGNVQWVMGVLESNASANDFFYLHIYVTTGDTDTPRGTFLANYTPGTGTEWPTAIAGATEGAVAGSSVNVSVGDRLVVEIGYQARNTSATSFTGTLRYGATGTTDLAAAATSVTTDPGWIELAAADGIWNTNLGKLVDTASAGSVDTTIWTATTGSVGVTSGRLTVDANGYSYLLADPTVTPFTPWHLKNSSLFCEVAAVPVGANLYGGLGIQADAAGTFLGIYYHQAAGTLTLENAVGFADGAVVTITYDPVAHRWWRIRHDGSSAYYETAPDGFTWTIRRTVTTAPSWTNYNDLRVIFEAGDSPTAGDNFLLDNFNTQTLTAAPAGTAPAGAPVTLSAATAAAAQPAATQPSGGQCTFTLGTKLTSTPAGALTGGSPVSLANITHPVVTGTPQGFAFTATGTVVTYTGGGATGAGVADVLGVNSDNVVDTPAGWTLEETYVQRQGSYIFTRPGGTTSVTIDLGGGISTSTSVLWVRVANTSGVDTGASGFAQATNVRDVSTPAFTSGALAAVTDLALAFAALHDLDTVAPTSPVWSSGYVQQASATNGGAVTGVYGNVAVKVPAGTTAESPSLSWTNSAGDRYMLFVAFLGAEAATGGDALTAQPAGTTPSGSPVALNTGTVLTVGPAGTSPSGSGVSLAAGTAVVTRPAGTSPAAGAASTFTGGIVLSAAPAATSPAGSPVGLNAGTAFATTPAGTTPSGAASTITAGTVLAATPAATSPSGSRAGLNTGTTLAATPAGTAPRGAASAFAAGTTLTASPAGTAPAGSPVGLVGGTVLNGAPAGTSPSGSGVTVTVGSAGSLNTEPAGTAPSGSPVGFAGGTVLGAQPAGTLPAGGTSTFTIGVPGATTLTAGAAGTLPGASLVQFTGGTILAVNPGGAAPSGSPVALNTNTTLSVAPASTQPSGAGVTSAIGYTLTAAPAATQPEGSPSAFAAGSLLNAAPGSTLPGGGQVTFTAREALVVVAASTTPTGSRVLFTGSATTQHHPGILTVGSSRAGLQAGTLPAPRLTAGTLRGPTYAFGGG